MPTRTKGAGFRGAARESRQRLQLPCALQGDEGLHVESAEASLHLQKLNLTPATWLVSGISLCSVLTFFMTILVKDFGVVFLYVYDLQQLYVHPLYVVTFTCCMIMFLYRCIAYDSRMNILGLSGTRSFKSRRSTKKTSIHKDVSLRGTQHP